MFLYFLAFLTILALIFKFWPSKPHNVLQKIDWKKDVVYLVQFPVSPKVRSISPFTLKLETWLRLVGIKYENIYTGRSFSKKGQIPFIELNGQQVADSNIAIDFLKDYFKDEPKVVEEKTLFTPEQFAMGHMARIMIENHTCLAGIHYRYVKNMGEFFKKMVTPTADAYPKVGIKLFRYVLPQIVKMRLYLHGLGRHSSEEIAHFSFEDLDTVSKILGEKPYFLGTKPSTIDCLLFGHLVQFLYIPMDFPQKTYLKENCQNIVDYVERMKSEFWPDWEQECQKDCMMGKMGRVE